ncbi:hypothetical protein BV898_15615 [Hypsibius exemplaris]|uniref:Eclosion hormone n=1 Tax=Hypsibius exemplaris TaxID=2072580 RepID=A0A9X6NBG6_HYPEX|nr:hypothetical protein BV898_15615 [Hypsibius exemplaris]
MPAMMNLRCFLTKLQGESLFIFVLVLLMTEKTFVRASPLVALTASDKLDTLEDNIALCVVACARCHDTLGTVFNHIKCTRQCVRHHGDLIPDCHSAKTVRQYLRREFLEKYL